MRSATGAAGDVNAGGRAARRPLGHSSTSVDEQMSIAALQRGWNGQPLGSRRGSGGSPATPEGFIRNAGSPITGKAAPSARVYG